MKHKMKKKFIDYFKKLTVETSKLSTCRSKQVGCLLVKDKRILALGYNGVPSGHIHCNKLFSEKFDRDEHHNWSNLNELHAEQNLISYCCKNGIKTKDCDFFISLSPCSHCAKLLLAAGIKNVYYLEEYDYGLEGIDFLKNNKINLIKI